jgi:hypothetical protein
MAWALGLSRPGSLIVADKFALALVIDAAPLANP